MNQIPFKLVLIRFGLLIIQLLLVPLSFMQLKWSSEGKGSIILSAITMVIALLLYVTYKYYKRSFINIFTLLNSFGAISILYITERQDTLFSHLLFILILVSSFGISILILVVQNRSGKNKLRFVVDKPKTISERKTDFMNNHTQLKEIWNNRKENGLIKPIYLAFFTEQEEEHDSITFILGEGVEYNSKTFRKEKS
ncbi:hypothetical protein [Cytobacillus sp. IB215665]|uniref:hypothetical protein n=1 Tax=Cytobacillus sp. IB215665 TaxID=3097357 RepID=UPI002A153E9A|nr:hypothetical protein [Cytobacillus sp. IB215665]MDX8367667.1 hypothetical protein [Cytobacillus sp. IB215665]